MNAVLNSARAELLRLRKWPVTWITVGTLLLLNVVFNYVFDYLTYRSGGTGGISDGVPPDVLLAQMMPAAVPTSSVQGMPMFGGAVLLILGALAVGSGYGWGTVKTVALQGPSRLAALGGTLLGLAVVLVSAVAATFTLNLGISLLVATTESQTIVWPAATDVAQSFGAALLVLGMWNLAGVVVGTLARGPALAVGLGLVWVLAVENLLRGVSNIWSPLESVTDALPGTAAGSLAGALGAVPVSEPAGTPGVLTVLSGPGSIALLATYLLVFVGATAVLVRRRDVT